jgi:membrane fusion protein (multidrug efflux system)
MNKPVDTMPQISPLKTAAGKRRLAVAVAALLLVLATLAMLMFAPRWISGLMEKESTEDAYVDGNVVQVTPQVAGTVTFIAADNTDFVAAGQPLLRLNPLDAELALSRAQAQLSKAVRQVRVQFANATQMKANVALRGADLAKAEADLARRKQLAASGAISGEDIHHAEDAVKSARAALTAAQQQLVGSEALIDDTTITTHPEVLNAISQVRDAYVAVARTTLAAPVAGIVTKRNVQLGQRVAAGTVLMSIVPLDHVWVNANFKESQLRNIRIGQKVTLSADVYGDAVKYTGRVVGQDAGTGSAFALLPAQNATGNWIKVVQRVPVRIALDREQLNAHPLKLGLSMKVEVDVRDQSGPTIATESSPRQSYKTDVFAAEMQQADHLVQSIIRASAGKRQANSPEAAGREASS